MNLEINYQHFLNGDFGNLSRIEVEKDKKGGYIDFWSSGCVNIHLIDTDTGEDLINIFLSPEQKKDVNKYLVEAITALM